MHTVWKFGDFFKLIDTFIQQECIKIVNSGSKDFLNVTDDFYF